MKAYTAAAELYPPVVITAPIIRYKPAFHSWSQPWLLSTNLRPIKASLNLGGRPGTLELEMDYGSKVKNAAGTAIGSQSPLPARGWWVQVLLSSDGATELAWVGKIIQDAREVHYEAATRAGKQTLIAAGPEYLLDKIDVDHAVWLRGTTEANLDRIPPMNLLDERGRVLGNRTTDVHGATTTRECYLYGGRELWSRAEYAKYILNRFADQRADDGTGGPSWRLSGQVALLDELRDQVSLGNGSVGDVLRRLISPAMGYDWRVRPDLDEDQQLAGFEVFVHALGDRVTSFGGATMPANAYSFQVSADQLQTIPHIDVIASDELRYGKIRVLGAPIICCCSLRANDPSGASLAGKWPAAYETEYKAGTGQTGSTAEQHDRARRADRYGQVYRVFAAPSDWDHQQKLQPPEIDNYGVLLAPAGTTEKWQNVVRRTLNYLPLLEGWSYQENPAVDHNAADATPEYIPPQGWILDPSWGGYKPLSAAGVGLAALQDDWGVALHPNTLPHILAKNHWSGAADTEVDPAYDHSTLVVTIALETDLRLALEWTAANWKPSDGVKTILVPDAELHYMVPLTVVGVDLQGNLIEYVDNQHLVIRNDATRLYAKMAGAIARYGNPRGKATVRTLDLRAVSDFVGAMLETVDVGGNVLDVNGIVTGVEWEFGGRALGSPEDNPTVSTTIYAGYA